MDCTGETQLQKLEGKLKKWETSCRFPVLSQLQTSKDNFKVKRGGHECPPHTHERVISKTHQRNIC
jgi:hypothetical protein